MSRYQLVYNKRGFPMSTWHDCAAIACKLALDLRCFGYTTSVWEHENNEVRELSDEEVVKYGNGGYEE